MDRPRNDRGIALASALLALAVMGGLVAGAMFVATQEQRIGRNTLRQQEAFIAAEAGTQAAVVSWAPAYDTLAVGGQVVASAAAPDGRGWYRRTIRRLGPVIFLVRTEGFDADSAARARVGMLLRLKRAAIDDSSCASMKALPRCGSASPLEQRSWVNLY
jgi:hypothetical protein